MLDKNIEGCIITDTIITDGRFPSERGPVRTGFPFQSPWDRDYFWRSLGHHSFKHLRPWQRNNEGWVQMTAVGGLPKALKMCFPEIRIRGVERHAAEIAGGFLWSRSAIPKFLGDEVWDMLSPLFFFQFLPSDLLVWVWPRDGLYYRRRREPRLSSSHLVLFSICCSKLERLQTNPSMCC